MFHRNMEIRKVSNPQQLLLPSSQVLWLSVTCHTCAWLKKKRVKNVKITKQNMGRGFRTDFLRSDPSIYILYEFIFIPVYVPSSVH